MMKKILFATTLIILFSCKEERPKNITVVDNAVNNNNSLDSSPFTKKGRGNNMIDQIYNELMKSGKNLQSLNDKIAHTSEESAKVISKYETIINQSSDYYTDAKYQAKSITDSVMKKEIEQQIKISSDHYDLKTKKINELINLINKNLENTNNLYISFKIKKTLLEIEKYQNAHPLETDSLENFINKQNQLINELKNLK